MKKYFLVTIILITNSAVAYPPAEFCFYAIGRSLLPEMVLDKENINLGNIALHSKHQVEVTVSNKGEATLVISDIMSGCGCIVVQTGKKEIKEGDTTVLTIRFTAMANGSFTKKITLTANIEGGTKDIYLRGNVTP